MGDEGQEKAEKKAVWVLLLTEFLRKLGCRALEAACGLVRNEQLW